MAGKSVQPVDPSERSEALRQVVAPQGFIGMGQFLALRRQARRQLITSSFEDLHPQEAARGQGEGQAEEQAQEP
jgi:hypothetical protein